MMRPVNDEEQKRLYSGKKKCHTKKNLIVIQQSKRIEYLSPTVDGTIHDKKLADICELEYPKESDLMDDSGFQGYTPENCEILRPFKKSKSKDLTPYQKAWNRLISRVRVGVEHVICSVKRCRAVQDTIRLELDGVEDLIMEICCGLHNFRVRLNPWLSLPEPGGI
jgi:DDE superfamily endonuclease